MHPDGKGGRDIWGGYESKKGYSYTYTDLNYKSNHRTQHKYDDKGRKNENKVSKKCLGLNEDDIKLVEVL